MEKQAMQFLNLLANKFFGTLFTWLLGQRFRDTLCGTKMIRKSDYEIIAANRSYFGDFDPFGDFDLIFGAVKQNLKVVEVPVSIPGQNLRRNQYQQVQARVAFAENELDSVQENQVAREICLI